MKALILIAGVVIGAIATYVMMPTKLVHEPHTASHSSKDEDEPLYWVAPMDPNFRRDQPGKSPMGMDLVPFYGGSEARAKGEVSISPTVVNNLGVTTSSVQYRALQPRIRAAGVVQYNQDTLVHVHPRVEGWVDSLLVKSAGAQVAKHQPLYSLYSPQLVNAQEQYLLALSQNNRSLIAAASDRLRSLQMPDAAIEQLKQQGKVQQNIIFSSPQEGVIDNLNIREGFYVQPGTTLMSVANLDEVWVEAEVFESQKSLLVESLPVAVRFDSVPNRQWNSRIDYIYPTLNPAMRTVRVRIRLDNSDKLLKPNMIADVAIKSSLQSEQLSIPNHAVIRTANRDRVVKVLANGNYLSQEVLVGHRIGDYTTILEGLALDDIVVTSAQFLIDSESYINTGLQKIANSHEHMQSSTDHTPNSDLASATVNGEINQITLDARQLNITRGAIEKWGRAPATMDFTIADGIDLSTFKPSDKVMFTFEIDNGDFVIMNIHKMAGATQ